MHPALSDLEDISEHRRSIADRFAFMVDGTFGWHAISRNLKELPIFDASEDRTEQTTRDQQQLT